MGVAGGSRGGNTPVITVGLLRDTFLPHRMR